MTRELTEREINLLQQLRSRVLQVGSGPTSFEYSSEEWAKNLRIPPPELPREALPSEKVEINVGSQDPDLGIEYVNLIYKDYSVQRPVEMFTFTPSIYEPIRNASAYSKGNSLVLTEIEKYSYILDPNFIFPHTDFNTLEFSVINQIVKHWYCDRPGRRRDLEVHVEILLPGVVLGEIFFDEAPEMLAKEMGARKSRLWLESARSYFLGSETITYCRSNNGMLIQDERTKLLTEKSLSSEAHKFSSILGEAKLLVLKREG